MQIIQLTSELCEKYKTEIANFIYLSMNRGCTTEWFSRDASTLKTEELKLYLKERKAYSYIAIDNEIEGFLWAYPYGNESDIYLSIIYVDEMSRDKHIGKMLISTLEAKVKEDGYQKIWLHTFANNTHARGFYNKIGFVEERIQLSKLL